MPKPVILILSTTSRYIDAKIWPVITQSLSEYHWVYMEANPYKRDIKETSTGNVIYLQTLSLPFANSYPAAFKSVLRSIYQLYKWKNAFLKKTDELDPAMVITLSPYEFSYHLLSQYRKKRKLALLQHGNLLANRKKSGTKHKVLRFIYNRLLGLPQYSNSDLNFNEDDDAFYLLWAPLWADHFPDITRKKIQYTGPVQYDETLKHSITRHNIAGKSKLNIVIYLNKKSFIGLDNWIIYAEFYKNLTTLFPQHSFLFKTHPAENFHWCREQLNGLNITNQDINLQQFDLVLTHWSSACYDSIASGIPTLLINPDGKFDLSRYRLQHYPLIATTPGQVQEFISHQPESFTNARNAFIHEQFGYADGHSMERLRSAIQKIIHA